MGLDTTLLFSKCDRVSKGTMVVFGRDNSILYVGQIVDAVPLSFPDGSLVVVNPEDHENLRSHVEKRRH